MLPLLKYWPAGGCLNMGWDNDTYRSLQHNSACPRRYNRSMMFTLGKAGRFHVLISDFFGTDSGVARSLADVYFKQGAGDYKLLLTCIPLRNPDDILGVVEALNERYVDADSDEAKEWRACMADFYKELQMTEAADFCYEPDGDLESGEVPEFIQDVIQDWRYTRIDDNSPDTLLEAFVRLERSWMAYSSCILANQFGDIYREELERSDNIGFVIDRKLHQTKDTERLAWLMNLYAMMMPCYIGTDFDEEKKNVEYEKGWDKAVAHDIAVESKPLTATKVQLLLRVRDANKRLPAHLSKFIKTQIPKYLKEEMTGLESLADDSAPICNAIRWLDNYRQARYVMRKDIPEMKETADRILNQLNSLMESGDDVHALDLYSTLLTNRFGCESAVEERDRLCKRVEEKLKAFVRTPDTRPSKAMDGNKDAVKTLVDEFTLAAIYLEILYLKKEEQDIDSFYWNLHEQNVYEERIEKESGRDTDFFFW